MKTHPGFTITAVVIALVGALGVAALWNAARGPVTVVGASRLTGSNRVTLHIRNESPDRVRLYSIWLWTSMGTNWALSGVVHLDNTNCTATAMNIDVDFPARPRPWKAGLVYMPAFSRLKLFEYRVKEAWNTKSLRSAIMLTGWEGARHADSPEIP